MASKQQQAKERQGYPVCGKPRPGDRIAQALVLPIPRVEFEEATELSATARGQGGFGSTGG